MTRWHSLAPTHATRPAIAVVCGLIALALLPTAAMARDRLKAVASWGYQLQNVDIGWVSGSPHDLFVTDVSRDGSEAEAFTPADVRRMRERPDGRQRIVLAYLSIGEAEAYRGYWRWYWGGRWYSRLFGPLFAPSWVGSENPQWRGNLAVRYWEPGWQQLILGPGGMLERILAQGFDGVYLDKIDSSIEAVAKERPSARADMRDFVQRIAEQGRAARPGFLVVPQNGEELLVDSAYLAIIDGIAKEDLLFGEDAEKVANKEAMIERRIEWLRRATAAGKPVLAVEYLDDGPRISAARARLQSLGFVPTFADRPLKTLRYGDLPASAAARAR